jgi:hypothetical protein
MLKLSEFRHNHHPSDVRMLGIFIRRGISVSITIDIDSSLVNLEGHQDGSAKIIT